MSSRAMKGGVALANPTLSAFESALTARGRRWARVGASVSVRVSFIKKVKF